jgi:DNA topoisomerase-1
MAKKKNDRDLVDLLRASGLRKKVAQALASSSQRRKGSKTVSDAAESLRKAASHLERRSVDPKRSEAAKKAARTRKRNAAKRSAAAKKGGKARAKAT